jgi:hypothetical protein
MDPDRRQRLEALPGWSWDILSVQWEEGFSQLKQFAEREGHCRVAQGYKTSDGYRLGAWVATRRNAKNSMDPDRRQRLEALPGWSWNTLSDKFEMGFSRLRKFAERERHCRVPRDYKTDDGYGLGVWVANRRKAKDPITPDRRQLLQSLPGWSWDIPTDRWAEGFSYLKQFAEREGHCRVSYGFKTDDNYALGIWVAYQRKRKDIMDAERRERLEALPGWSWDILSDKWEEGFSSLKQFSDHHGHCRVLSGYGTDDSYPLAQWVGVQRRNRGVMDPIRRQRLEALPSWVWKIEK